VACVTLVSYICPTTRTQCQILLKALICSKQTARTSYAILGSEHTVMFAVLLAVILQGVERPWSV